MLPSPTFRTREIDPGLHAAAQAEGFSPLQARLLASRMQSRTGPTLRQRVAPTLAKLDPPDTLPDINVAAKRLAQAIAFGEETLVVCVDHDVDGSVSGSILVTALVEMFGVEPRRVQCFLSHKLREGYGVSTALVERMLESLPPNSLLITADQGSCDNERFELLCAAGHSVIVTDHHHVPPEGPPTAAIACVNPSRADSEYPDRAIAGCAVAWLLCWQTRKFLIDSGYLTKDAPSLAPLLDYVAIGTCADAVSLSKSVNNRAFLRYGLHLMNTSPRPVWAALREALGKEGPWTASDIAFQLGPILNSRGRLGDAIDTVQLLLSKDFDSAYTSALKLIESNKERRAIEKRMQAEAMEAARLQAETGSPVIVVHFPDGHPGVGGIVASRLVEAFGRPAACFSPRAGQPGILTGSLRSIPGVDIYRALQRVAEKQSATMRNYGGHSQAAGVGLDETKVIEFHEALGAAILEQEDTSQLGPVIWTDGPLPEKLDWDLMDQLETLEPFGRDFDPPTFEGIFTVSGYKAVGDGTHLRVFLKGANETVHRAMWFGAIKPGMTAADLLQAGKPLHVVMQLHTNIFRGNASIDIHIRHAQMVS